MLKSTLIDGIVYVGNKKRSDLEAESLSTTKNLQKVIPFQIALHPLCFLLRVNCCFYSSNYQRYKNIFKNK